MTHWISGQVGGAGRRCIGYGRIPIVGLLMVLALTGCGSPADRASDQLLTAVQDAQAVVRSALMAVELLGSGRLTLNAARVTCQDAATELAKAEQEVIDVDVPEGATT